MSACNLNYRYELLCESRIGTEAMDGLDRPDTGHFNIPGKWLAAACARDTMTYLDSTPSTSGRDDGISNLNQKVREKYKKSMHGLFTAFSKSIVSYKRSSMLKLDDFVALQNAAKHGGKRM